MTCREMEAKMQKLSEWMHEWCPHSRYGYHRMVCEKCLQARIDAEMAQSTALLSGLDAWVRHYKSAEIILQEDHGATEIQVWFPLDNGAHKIFAGKTLYRAIEAILGEFRGSPRRLRK